MTVFRSTRVLVDGEIRPADVVVARDRIEAVACHGSEPFAQDLGDLLVVAGFVDLHSDAVEKEIEPRPGAAFPVENAMVELDRKLAMAGITTMFHAIAFNEESLVGLRGNASAAETIRSLQRGNRTLLQVDNLVHARWEITSFSSVPVIRELLDEGCIQLLSFMDHSPGQGQFRTLEHWKRYHVPVYDLDEFQVAAVVREQLDKRQRCLDHLRTLAGHARKRDVLLASHDDDTTAKVDLMRGLGVSIAEFPLNRETAAHARQHQVPTGMGAPNVVRGRSQNGNISARDLIGLGLCDFLCSDYHPGSLLQAVYALHRQASMPLAAAFALVSSRPAAIAGLADRGSIEAGKLADILVIDDGEVPKTVMTVKAGNIIYSSRGCACGCAYV